MGFKKRVGGGQARVEDEGIGDIRLDRNQSVRDLS